MKEGRNPSFTENRRNSYVDDTGKIYRQRSAIKLSRKIYENHFFIEHVITLSIIINRYQNQT